MPLPSIRGDQGHCVGWQSASAFPAAPAGPQPRGRPPAPRQPQPRPLLAAPAPPAGAARPPDLATTRGDQGHLTRIRGDQGHLTRIRGDQGHCVGRQSLQLLQLLHGLHGPHRHNPRDLGGVEGRRIRLRVQQLEGRRVAPGGRRRGCQSAPTPSTFSRCL